MRVSFLFFVLASWFVILGYGQVEVWRTYTNTNYIFDISGNDSVLSVATAGGLVILDVRAEPPRVERTIVHTNGLGANRCLAVSQDWEGNIWVGTDGAGLAVVPKDSNRAFLCYTNELPTRIRSVIFSGHRLLLGTEQGFFVIDTRGTPLNFNDDGIRHFQVNEIRALLSDWILAIFPTDGFYWIGTNQGVTCVDTGFSHWRGFRQPLGDSVSGIGVLPDGRVILGTERGLAVGDTSGFIPLVFFPDAKRVNDVVVYNWDIYFATADTLFKADTAGTLLPVLVNRPQTLFLGEAFWVGCGGSEEAGWGLWYQRSGASWQRVDFACLVSGVITDCAFGKDGSAYLGHNSSWFSRIMPDGTLRVLNSPLPWVVQIRCDSRGRLWFTHFSYRGGVSMYDPEADTWATFQWGETSRRNVIQAFGLDRRDTKWVFNLGGTVIAIDSVGRQQEFNLPELVPPPGGSYEFAFDSRNRVWLGMTNGLAELDYGGTLFDLTDDQRRLHSSGLPSLEVRSVVVDQQDRVWVATPQGAAVWTGNGFEVYNTNNSGLLSNNIYRVRCDGSGRLWFLSDAGLSIFDVATGRWINYTPQNSGMIPNPQGLAGFYTALEINDRDGVAGIGSLRGFSFFSFLPPAETTGSELRVYPNPCVLNAAAGVVIDGLPPDARVKVYTLNGQPVASLSVSPGLGRAVWYPRNVATGLYIIVATSSRGVRTERVALVVPERR